MPPKLHLSTSTVAVARFMLGGLLAAAIIAGAGYWVVTRNAVAEATRNAQEIAAIDGRGIVAPALSTAVVDGDPAAVSAFDKLVRDRVLSSRVVRVKLWTPNGKIVYSDAGALVGRTFQLEGDELEALRAGKVVASVSQLDKPENQFERAYGHLLEVYLPVQAASGDTFLFETYQVYSSIEEDQRRILSAFFPVLAGGVVLLFAVQAPLAWQLARSLDAARRESEAHMRRSLEASERERRRIARDLHDGVVQTLAGVAFSLGAAASRDGVGASIQEVLQEAAGATRQAVTDLRTLIIDIAPPNLEGSRLEGALADLLAAAENDGVATSLQVSGAGTMGREAAAVMFRAAQEAIRNSSAHAGATRVDVALSAVAGEATLEISDDGRGFTADEVIARMRDGHVGLAMLKSLVDDAGGELQVSSTPGAGSKLTIKLGTDG